MRARDKLLFMFFIWLVVYPGVLLFGGAVRWAVPDWPFWLQILVSTGLTVPLISIVALPLIERTVAWVEGISRAELKQRQATAAREAEKA